MNRSRASPPNFHVTLAHTLWGDCATMLTLGSFGVALIPLTLERTVLGALAVGDAVNLEIDVIARYVARLAQVGAPACASKQH